MGTVSRVPSVQDQFISNLFLVKKKDGKNRPVINLKQLDGFVEYQHFKMKDISVLKDLLRPNDWMVKLDLKDAYFCVSMYIDFRKYPRFKWGSSTREFNCLPFGYGPAPRKFTKIFKPVLAFLQKKGMCLIIYINNKIILSQNQQDLIKDREL